MFVVHSPKSGRSAFSAQNIRNPRLVEGRALRTSSGFTLIEIMMVVLIIGIIGTIGIPAIVHSMRKEGMRKATADLMDGCSHARAAAIFSGNTAELVIRPQDRAISINASGGDGVKRHVSFTATMPESIRIEIMGVNFIEYQDEEEARVHFFPNGTSDEFAIVLRSDEGEVRKITLDIVSAFAEMEIVR